MNKRSIIALSCAFLPIIITETSFAKPAPAPSVSTAQGKSLQSEYAKELAALRADIEKQLPRVDKSILSSYTNARQALKKAEEDVAAADKELAKIYGGKALIDHAKKKWIAGAEKGISDANAALKKATTDAERDAAKKQLADWQKNKADGEAALKERQAAYDQALKDQSKFTRELEKAKNALAKAKSAEASASSKLFASTAKAVATDALDSKLLKSAILAEATPAGLALFAEQSPAHKKLIDDLFANPTLMKQMLISGGAKFAKYGRAMEILDSLKKVIKEPSNPTLQNLALAVCLEHASPVKQTNAADQANAPTVIDPIKRYTSYEKAFLAGELDPAFKSFNAWELRHVVNCEAPEEIAAWGREMLRSYRPDQINTPDYGWRYVNSVKSDVPYGSQNVCKDLPSLHHFQNIALNGGVCGRRAFYGRFMLRSFGIPTWGVTQKAHAALSHWTPKGWVVNLGAGYSHSWWDKDEVPRSGSDFLLETQARAHGSEYIKVLRAKWISVTLGETQFNDRQKVEGGFWSQLAQNQTITLASSAATLGPLGQELGEANEAKQKLSSAKVTAADQKIHTSNDGTITIPAVAHTGTSGGFAAMASHNGGMQIHITAGYHGKYEFTAPRAGKYTLSAKVAALQDFHKLTASVNGSGLIDITVPHTIGLWENTPSIEIALNSGKNVISLQLEKDSRGLTVKELILTPVK